MCADLRGKGFHFVCVCSSQAYLKNTITNSRDTISNDCQCVFLPDSDAAEIAADHLAAERSLGWLTREPRASRGGLQGNQKTQYARDQKEGWAK